VKYLIKELQCLQTSLRGHTDYVHSVALRSNAQQCLSASEDGTVRLWGIDTLYYSVLILFCCISLVLSLLIIALLVIADDVNYHAYMLRQCYHT